MHCVAYTRGQAESRSRPGSPPDPGEPARAACPPEPETFNDTIRAALGERQQVAREAFFPTPEPDNENPQGDEDE
jgi:hypothetical protein